MSFFNQSFYNEQDKIMTNIREIEKSGGSFKKQFA